jgi:hypothetical protein
VLNDIMIVVKSFLDKTFKQGDFEVTSKGQKMEKIIYAKVQLY